jgi:Anti-sigma-K factor rskA
VAGTELAPDASAVARVEETGSGVAIELDVRDLPPAEPGTYYHAWLKGPDGLVTVGTFHMQDGDNTVELWSGVPLDRYPTLTVTLQQEGAGQESSGQVVLTAEIGP